MLKKNNSLDVSAKNFLEKDDSKKKLEKIFGKIKEITFTEHLDDDDLKGIDGWITFIEGERISFSLRNREIHKKYGADGITWTYKWKSGEEGEWFYSEENIRIHLWSKGDEIVKCVVALSEEIFKNYRKGSFGYRFTEVIENTENNQHFILVKLARLISENLAFEIA